MFIKKAINRNGLTLIELVIVMAVIAIISAITVPVVNNYIWPTAGFK